MRLLGIYIFLLIFILVYTDSIYMDRRTNYEKATPTEGNDRDLRTTHCLNQDTSSCDVNKGSCIDTGNGWNCDCKNGYQNPAGDKKRCEDKDECNNGDALATCPANIGNCVNVPGSYECHHCRKGFHNPFGNNRTCEDKDECTNGDSLVTCPVNAGSCTNIPGKFKCSCKNGYDNFFGDKQICKDVNECETVESSTCIPERGSCINMDGDWKCQCKSHYKNVDPHTCEEQHLVKRFATETGQLEYPSNGGNYGNAEHKLWVLETTPGKVLKLNFTRFDTEYCNRPRCRCDFLNFEDGTEAGSPRIATHCGNNYPGFNNVYYTLHNYIRLRFRSDSSTANQGFELSWTSVIPEVIDKRYFEPNGEIDYPGDGRVYGISEKRVWTIETTTDQKLFVAFLKIDIEYCSGPMCRCDYLEFQSGFLEGSETLDKICTFKYDVYYPPSNYFRLKFISDHGTHGKGFKLHYRAYQRVNECGNFVNSTGTLDWPSGSANYGDHEECYWVFSTDHSKSFKLVFTMLHIESCSSCRCDYLQIWDDMSRDAESEPKYCGSGLPRGGIYYTKYHYSILHFKSDSGTAKKGFEMSWTTVPNLCLTENTASCRPEAGECMLTEGDWKCQCSPGYTNVDNKTCEQHNFVRRLTSSTGSIKFPEGNDNYGNSKNLLWIIETSPGSVLKLTFTNFDIELCEHPRCRCDYLELQDGLEQGSPTIYKYCGDNPPGLNGVFYTPNNYIRLLFRSDGSEVKQGFTVDWNKVSVPRTDGRYFSHYGELDYPGNGSNYPNNDDKTWTLETTQDRQLLVLLPKFDLEKCKFYTCPCDSLELQSGFLPDGTSLGKLCPNDFNVPQKTYFPPSNYLRLTFKSDATFVKTGFKLHWFAYQQKFERGKYSDPKGTLEFPGGNPKWWEAIWIITTDPGKRVHITFTSFDVTGCSSSCSCNYVQVITDLSKDPLDETKYCGTKLPGFQGQIYSLYHYAIIIFGSNSKNKIEGFKLSWETTD